MASLLLAEWCAPLGGVDMLSVNNMFMNRIHDQIDSITFDMALCHVSPVHSQITSLGFLSYYLLERREKGIFVSVTRPFYYMERLLTKSEVPLTMLTSIDALTRDGSSNFDPRCASSTSVCEDLSTRISKTVEDTPDIKFIIVDNISGLIPYASPMAIVQFIDGLHEIMMTRSDLQIIVLVDHEVDHLIMKGITGLCDRRIEISPVLLQ